MSKYIVVRTQYEGIHRYKDAPEQVKFLRDYHRHIFNVEAKLEVFHNDRELEFIMVKQAINTYFDTFLNEFDVYEMGDQSCEMIAENLIKFLKTKYGKRKIVVSVFEDNENGAIVEGEN